MNNRIRSLDYDKLIFFDLEMASGEKKLDPKSSFFKIFQWKNRNKETDELPTVKETQELYQKKAALDAISGKIVSGVCGYCKDNKIHIKAFSGDEKDVVGGVVNLFEKSKRMIVGFNSNGFDLPYLRRRHSILKLGPYPETFNDVGKKPWTMDHTIDLMDLFKGSGFYTSSLDELCWAYDVKSPKTGDVKGSEVSKVFYEGGIEQIVEYNIRDVVATINLFRALRGDEQIEEIEYHTD